ncbi:MAG TPA: VCBS repeat-containing protein, partial [Spirochaetota bacterium]|nr:VCBS repeat-containing protein [Spirochaetota bacterium]
DDEKLWDYTLEYVTGEDSERPLIKTIVSSRNTTKPEFIYQKAEHSLSWQGVNNPFASDEEIDPLTTEFFEGDFNGDGLSDMVVFNPETGDWKAAECSRTGGYEFKKYGNKFKGYKGTEKIKWFKGNVSGDYNGDGRSDIAFYLPETKEFFVAEHDGKVFNFVKYGELSEYLPDIFACEWFPGDYDGNGLSDALLYNEPDGSWILMKNEGGKFSFVKCSVSFKHLYRNDYSADLSLNSDMTSDRSRYGSDRSKVHFLSGDYNADGRTDIALYDSRSGRWYVGENYRDEVNGFKLNWKLYKEFTPRESVLFGFDRFSGDFNGDGYSDFMLFDRENGEWIIGETGNETINFKTFSKTPEFKYITRWFQGDFNGDGRTDIGFYSKTDNCVWVGEARRDGFNYRVYSDVSYGGPDAQNVFVNVPLPQNEIRIEKGYGASGDGSAVNYEFDANYEFGGGEKVFAGNFEGNGIQLLVYKNAQKKLFIKRSGILSPLNIDADLSSKDVSLPLGERAVRNGSNDSVLFMKKVSDEYVYEAFSSGSSERVASINSRDFSFDPKKSLYSFLCDNGGISMFFLEDNPSTGVPLVYRFKNGSAQAFSIEGIDASLLYNLRNAGAMIVLLNGEIVLIDKRTNPDTVYLGKISANDIIFKKISNMTGITVGENYRTEIIPGDGYFIVPSSSNGNVKFTRASLDYDSGIGNVYSFTPEGCSYSGIFSNGIPFVQTEDGLRCIVTGANSHSVKKPSDAFITEVKIAR